MARRRVVMGAAGTVLTLAALGTYSSSAATLGGASSGSLGAWNLPGSPAPAAVVEDGFDYPDGTNLDGRPRGGNGAVWQVLSGTWTALRDGVRDSTGAEQGAVVVDCGPVNARITTEMTLSSDFSAGLALKRVPSGYIEVNYRDQANGRIEVATEINGGRTTLAAANPVGRLSSATLAATYVDGVITVLLDGQTRLTTILSPADRARFGASTTYGMATRDDPLTRFESFRCEAAP